MTELFRIATAADPAGHHAPRAAHRGRDRQDLAGGLRRLRDAARPRRRRIRPPSRRRPSRDEEVFLDLAGWEDDRPTWEAANRGVDRAMERPRGRAERQRARPVPGAGRRAARPDRGVHARRDPDLDADAVADPHADAIADAVPDADRHRDPDAAAGRPRRPTLPPVTPIAHARRRRPRRPGGLELGDRRPSPPSSRRPPRTARTRGCSARASRTARRSAPVPDAVDDHDAVEPGQERLVEVGLRAARVRPRRARRGGRARR